MARFLPRLFLALGVIACAARPDVYPDPREGGAGAVPHRGGTLRIVRESDPDSLDPAVSGGWYTSRILVAVHRRLLEYVPAEEPEGYRLQPDLATALPEVSADGRSYSFTVRRGVRFAPPVGREIEPRDFATGLERVLKASSSGTPNYTGLVGARDFQDGRAPSVRGIAIDGQRITFTLEAPDPTFANKLALLHAAPWPREVGKSDAAVQKVATGPYRIASYQPRRSILLVRNPNAETPGFVDRMEIRIGVSVENAYAMLRHGELDAVIGDAPPSQLFRFRRDRRWKSNAFLRNFPDMTWVVMNATVEPFDDPRVRRAVCHAIDPRAIVKAVLGVAVVPKGLLPSSVPGYEPGLPCAGHDLAQAKALLAEAGLPDGFDSVLYAYNVNPFPRMAEALQAMLGEAGIRIEVRVVDGSVWEGVVGKRETRPPMVMSEWIASLPDPSDWLENNFSPLRLRAEANTNLTAWDTPRGRQLFQTASRETDPARRLEAYRAAGRAVTEEALAVPIAEGLAFNVVGGRVRGFVFHPIWGPLLAKLWLVRP